MSKKEDTPLIKQYREIKEQYSEEILFFRLGDFYEMFADDAVKASKALNLVLTKRVDMPMCGVPYHASSNYIKRLLDQGFKVALCEQISLPDKKSEIAKREVVKVFTPGTVVDEEFIEEKDNSFLLALHIIKKDVFLSWCDVSTGTLRIEKSDRDSLISLLNAIKPREILISDDLYFSDKNLKKELDLLPLTISKIPSSFFSLRNGRKEVERLFSSSALSIFNIDEKDPILSSLGALIYYIRTKFINTFPDIKTIEKVDSPDFLFLDSDAVRDLELFSSFSGGKGTLYTAMNRTKTAPGARYLKDQIEHPLKSVNKINERLFWVEYFLANMSETERVRSLLSLSRDIERLIAKTSLFSLNAQNVLSLSSVIKIFFSISESNNQYEKLLKERTLNKEDLLSFSQDAERAINTECTNLEKEGTIILPLYDDELDKERDLVQNHDALLYQYANKIREEEGINIKVGENKIIGMYIEVSKAQSASVPPYFQRIQTLLSSERYTSDYLEDIKRKSAFALEIFKEHEKKIFNDFKSRALLLLPSLRVISEFLTLLDFYSSLAALADEEGYTRPLISEEKYMEIIDGRHPVVEQIIGRADYVANSFSTSSSRFAFITGPNMAGKSTFLRQNAIIAIMAHMGSFVPAKKATIPLIDKIFSRVGASDNLTGGESTFLIEMKEAAKILRNSTSSSLVIVDEIGRGTSTEDGMSIAYAVMEGLKRSGAITFFATHFKELSYISKENAQFIMMKVSEEKDRVYFLKKAVEGISPSSYGIHVARLAGLPNEVIREAVKFQKNNFASFFSETREESLFTENTFNLKDEIIEEIKAFDENNSRPVDALLFISEIKKLLLNEDI